MLGSNMISSAFWKTNFEDTTTKNKKGKRVKTLHERYFRNVGCVFVKGKNRVILS